MQKQMDLNEQEIAMFVRYAVEEEELQAIIESKNDAALKLFLHAVWFKFREQ